MVLRIEDLGLVPYAEAHAVQLQRLESRLAGEIPDTLLLLEHPPVITLGRGTDQANLLAVDDLDVIGCERGGDVTLHAPGQLVGYVIRLLTVDRRDLQGHLRMIEDVLMGTLTSFDMQGRREPGATGVWIGERKIASIGVACRRWCTWHGFALNVSTDLDLFTRIRPCGFDAGVMTSIEREHDGPVRMEDVKHAVAREAERLFALD